MQNEKKPSDASRSAEDRLAEFIKQMARIEYDPLEYDPVCHCGTPLSSHSAYDNHSFTEMDTHESMAARIAALEAERDALKKNDKNDNLTALRNALRKVIVAVGGVAEDGVSDEFLVLAPGEVESKIASLKAERDALAARGYEDAKSIIWSVMMFWTGNEGHHVLRLVENGIWSADKAAEVLRVLLHGTPVELPDVVADAVYCGDVDALAARDERMKREGALEALRGLPPRHERRFGSLEYIRGYDAYREFVDAALAAIAALEKGKSRG